MKKILLINAVAVAGLITTSAIGQVRPNELAYDNIITSHRNMPYYKTLKEIRKEERMNRRAQVGYLTMQNFNRDFPDARNVASHREQNMDEVWFSLGNVDYIAFYDFNGGLIGTTTEKGFVEIPANAQNVIKRDYPDYYVQRVILFDNKQYNQNNSELFGQQISEEDNYFVELRKPGKSMILKVTMEGDVSFFQDL